MRLTEQQYELTGAYVRQELTGKALTDFEAELDRNTFLQQEVIFQKSILSSLKVDRVVQAIHQAKTANIPDDKQENPQLKIVRNNIRQARIHSTNRRLRIRWWVSSLAAAACLVLVSLLGLRAYLGSQLDGDMAAIAATVEREGIPLSENIKEVSARTDVIRKKLEDAEQAFKQEIGKHQLE